MEDGAAACSVPAAVLELVQLATKEIECPNLSLPFRFEDLKTLPYMAKTRITRQGCHAGQRKLLLSEIQFLTCCASSASFVLYIGSAPCEKLPVLLRLFPGLKFLLVDPNFHTYSWNEKPVIVYQNVDAVSESCLTTLRTDRGRKRGRRQQEQRCSNATWTTAGAPVYCQTYRGDMSHVDCDAHRTAMQRIQKEFETVHFTSLVRDMLQRQERVYIIQDYMTESLATRLQRSIAYANSPDMLLISDVRTAFFRPLPTDLDCIWNDALQILVLKRLRPRWSMLKFHPPYMDPEQKQEMHSLLQERPQVQADLEKVRSRYGLDLLHNYHEGVYRYLRASVIWLQAWAPSSTSEARLIVSRDDLDAGYVPYDHQDWDNRFMYNKYTRGYAFYGLFYKCITDNRLRTSYDACFDCALEMLILLNYLHGHCAAPRDIDPVRLQTFFQEAHIQDTLVGLRALLDAGLVNGPEDKATFHGCVREPLRQPIFYLFDPLPLQVWYDETRLHMHRPDPQSCSITLARSVTEDRRQRFWDTISRNDARRDARFRNLVQNIR